MFGITDLTTYLLGTIAIVLLPGPNSMYVLTTAAQHGIRRGYSAALGVFVGDTVIMVTAVVGVIGSILLPNTRAKAIDEEYVPRAN